MDQSKTKSYASALYSLITVFFFWGFLAASNGVFIPFCKTHFQLTQFESQLIDFTFYGGYFIGSLILYFVSQLTKVDLLNKIGYKNGIIYGSQLFNIPQQVKTWLGVAGSVILFGIGIHYLLKKADVSYNAHTPASVNRTGYFFKGFLMCIFNPTILFHWITVIGTASTIYHIGVPHRQFKIALMFSTILIVQFGLDTTKAFYANKLRDKISVSLIHKLNYVAGIALIVAAFIILDRLVTHILFPAIR